jgi:hypothetical protein
VETLIETGEQRSPATCAASLKARRADHFSVGQGFDETVNPMTAGSFAPFTA